MQDKLGDKVRLQHILDAMEELESYVFDLDYTEFEEDSMVKNASIRQLEVIGEACSRLSEGLKKSNPTVSWKQIIGLRNILIHQYFGVDEKLVWDVIQNDIPKLKRDTQRILRSFS